MSFASRRAELDAKKQAAEESEAFHKSAMNAATDRKREAVNAINDLAAWSAVAPAVRQKLLELSPDQLALLLADDEKQLHAAKWPQEQGLIRVVARRSGGRFNMLTGYDVSLTKAGDAAVALARRGADWLSGK
jgi:hypothetical protein